jgi:hypothetical protein
VNKNPDGDRNMKLHNINVTISNYFEDQRIPATRLMANEGKQTREAATILLMPPVKPVRDE